MRIVQAVGWYFPETTGGTEVYVDALARRLQQRGHEVEIVAPDPSGRPMRFYDHHGIRVNRFPIGMPLTRAEAQGHNAVRGAEWFHRHVAATRPDIVHFHTLVPGLELPEVQAAKATGARVIATTHASSLGYICARGTMMRRGRSLCDGLAEPRKCAACDLMKRGLPEWAANGAAAMPVSISEIGRLLPGKIGTAIGMPASIAFNLRRQAQLIDTVDRLVVLTQWAFDTVVRNGAPGTKLVLNRLGTAADFVRKPGSAAQPTTRPVAFGYLGRFDPIKGVLDLARAVAALAPDVPFALDVRGPLDTADARAVQREMQAIVGGNARVTFGEPLRPDDVPAHLAALDVLCCPSACLEGGPTVALEAHAAGTPVVGTRIGGLAELVADGVDGRLVEPGDWRAFADVLLAVAADPAGTVDRWRDALRPARTMDDVTRDYVSVYAA